MNNIDDFKIGDIICLRENPPRIEEYFNGNLGISMQHEVKSNDGSYIGTPFELMDIENGLIYLKRILKGPMHGWIHTFPLITHSEGWYLFKWPKGISEKELTN